MPSQKGSKRSAGQPAARSESPPGGQELVITGEQAIQQAVAEAVGQQTSQAQGEAYEPPCSISGLMAGLSGGMLGYVFGFGGHQFKHKGPGRLRASHLEGWTSARTFAVMGAIFAAASCFSKRLRLKDDVWNGVVAGASTGLVLGWKSGPMGALQSAFSLGAFSYVCDLLGSRAETRSAHAACLPRAELTSRQLWHRRLALISQRRQQQQASSRLVGSNHHVVPHGSSPSDLPRPSGSTQPPQPTHTLQGQAPLPCSHSDTHIANECAPLPANTTGSRSTAAPMHTESRERKGALQPAKRLPSCSTQSFDLPSPASHSPAEHPAASATASAAANAAQVPCSNPELEQQRLAVSEEYSHADHSNYTAAVQAELVESQQQEPCMACRLPAAIVLEALQGLQAMVAPGIGFGAAAPA